MQRSLHEGDVPPLHNAVDLWIPDSVKFSLLVIAAHLPFPEHGVELSEVLGVQKSFDSGDAKVREVGFFAVKCFEWRLHLERLMRSPGFEVHRRHEQLPPRGRLKTAVCEHASNHGAHSSPHAFGHTGLLRHVGSGELLDKTGFQAVRPKLLLGVLASLASAPTNNAATERNERQAEKQLKQLESLVLVGRQVDGCPLGVLVGYVAGVLLAAYDHWREGPYQVPVAQLERVADLMNDCHGVSKLLSFPHGTYVAIRNNLLECNTSAVLLA